MILSGLPYSPWISALSLLGLTPLAERVSFSTEQIAIFTGPIVGGLLNAICGNVTVLIIVLFASLVADDVQMCCQAECLRS
ncbi:Vacuolar cation/proton exchanger 1a [Sarracenia purpurea var. burkii]